MVRMLELKIYEKNKLIKKVTVDEDLFNLVLRKKKDLGTNQFGRILAMLFTHTVKGGREETTLVATDGTTKRVYIKNSVADGGSIAFDTAYSDIGCKIKVGNGTTPASRNDYDLENTIAEAEATANYTEDYGYVTISACFTFDTEVTISEVGLIYKLVLYGPTPRDILLDRTVLVNPITINPGQSLCITYKIAI